MPMTGALRALLTAVALLAALSCGDRPAAISVQAFPAVLASEARGEQAQWDTVSFGGSPRSPAGTYRIAPEPLLTDWNIAALRPVTQPDGTGAAAIRLNAYGAQRLQEYSADPANLRQPLGVRIDGRWAEFAPLLTPTRDRLILYGFTADELQRLERHIASR
ncbi:MAG: hypothetical protein AB1505_12830 [Candidatus Latescibacterota bacterium]